MTWEDLEYWDSGEFQVVQERLDDLDKAKKKYNPNREKLFAAMDAVELDNVRVMIVGQDPYPDQRYATGIAFDIPASENEFPQTLQSIFKEYCDDLQYPYPKCGSLMPWISQGVFLWNAVPSVDAGGKSLSHNWVEWHTLTQEVIRTISVQQDVVFAFLGSFARDFVKSVNSEGMCKVIETAHPSPRTNMIKNLKNPFFGSRLFSTINDNLIQLGHSPINWRL